MENWTCNNQDTRYTNKINQKRIWTEKASKTMMTLTQISTTYQTFQSELANVNFQC